MLLEQGADRLVLALHALLGKLGLHLRIHRGVFQMLADVVRDIAKRTSQPERDTPAPVHHEVGRSAERVEHPGSEQRAHQQANGRGGGNHGAVETAMVLRRILGDERGGAGIFTGSREALHHTHKQEQQRSANADDGVARQAADKEGGAGHHEDGDGQSPLTTLLITHVAPENGTKRTDQERQREHAERHHG